MEIRTDPWLLVWRRTHSSPPARFSEGSTCALGFPRETGPTQAAFIARFARNPGRRRPGLHFHPGTTFQVWNPSRDVPSIFLIRFSELALQCWLFVQHHEDVRDQ